MLVSEAMEQRGSDSQVRWAAQMGMAEDTAPLFGSPIIYMSASTGGQGRVWISGDYDGRPGREFTLVNDIFSLSLPGACGGASGQPAEGAIATDRAGDTPSSASGGGTLIGTHAGQWRMHRTGGAKPLYGISSIIGLFLAPPPPHSIACPPAPAAGHLVTFTWTGVHADAAVDAEHLQRPALGRLRVPVPT